ncbi:helix-turn-helix domain-containing protein [Leisingera aquaemixtae]|uniref:Helix-turn-helix domain-containing protein n=1 Tax=Leisingera aquaemixtae TaxID=1396826 RepID=A0ABY5WEN5_9RHOB|nr:helix-turn-helix domain-containing protein [Leisingera aquaemixtae]UWQ39930.1 helix-turn-helix domain-containing protein [Leisingera aquaemixtae]
MAFKADLLRKKLNEEGKTRDELAKATNKNKRTVSRWLAGENPPKPTDLEAIARVLNCSPQDFDPFFSDMGLGEVSIHAHVSAASHNAYELMRWRYGVSQRQIMELAPVLFSIVAGHALKVPQQDNEVAQQAFKNGLSDPRHQGGHIEEQASKLKKCFGLKASDPGVEISRNLFSEAIRRLSSQINDYVDTGWFVGAEPTVAPNAAGFIPDTELLDTISGGDRNLAEAIVKGRIRLSVVLQRSGEGKDRVSIEEFADAIRHEHARKIDERRQAGIKKLKAWRAFYAERHPDLAEEYDLIVAQHCHEEGWYPEGYTDDDRDQSYVNPYLEDHHINEDTLSEYQRLKAENSEKGKFSLVLPHQDPVCRRFGELQRHRARIKKGFEEAWS